MSTIPQLGRLDLTETFGIGYIGSILSAILYGITCIQAFHYFRGVGKDPVNVKALVLLLLVLDTVHQGFITALVYHYLVDNFNNPGELERNTWAIAVEIIITAVIAFIVVCFLVTRLWALSGKNKIVTGVASVLTVTHLVMNLIFPIKTLPYRNIVSGARELKPIGTTGLAVAVFTNVYVSGGLCYYLQRGRTGFKKSDDIVTKLIALVITTGLLSTLFVIANLVALVVAPDKLYDLFFNFLLGKSYINALLTTLNAREMIQNSQTTTSNNTLSTSFQTLKSGRSAKVDAINVVVDVEAFSNISSPGEQGNVGMMKLGVAREDSR
ncbi:hypothetical protein AB1N83_005644 [Pleurotus pulmonarius]